MHFFGLIIGIASFLIIGLFHPIVVKAEYYLGKRCWWLFLLIGIIGTALSLMIDNLLVSIILAVFSFSAFWGIGELIEQEKRVQRGWFPRNPKRHYPFDDEKEDKTCKK